MNVAVNLGRMNRGILKILEGVGLGVGMTLAEKILAKKAGKSRVIPGEIVMAQVDCAMMTDILGPRVQIADEMKRLGCAIWNSKKTVVVADHYSPAANAKQAGIVAFSRKWAQENGTHYFEGLGPCHQILAEKGLDRKSVV